MGEAMIASIDVDALAADLKIAGWTRNGELGFVQFYGPMQHQIWIDSATHAIEFEAWPVGVARLRPIEITHPIWMTATEIIRKHTTAASGREDDDA